MNRGKSENPTCAQCGDVVNPSDTFKDAWCSKRCFHQDRGEDLLQDLEDDLTVCPDCMKPIVEKGVVAETHPNNFTGYQYPTEHAEFDEGLYCSCGSRSRSDKFLREHDLLNNTQIAKNIIPLIQERTERGQYDIEIDGESFINDVESGNRLAESLHKNITQT